jgi:hypothetical protein
LELLRCFLLLFDWVVGCKLVFGNLTWLRNGARRLTVLSFLFHNSSLHDGFLSLIGMTSGYDILFLLRSKLGIIACLSLQVLRISGLDLGFWVCGSGIQVEFGIGNKIDWWHGTYG